MYIDVYMYIQLFFELSSLLVCGGKLTVNQNYFPI